ncbi:twin-arginine translocase subunit TatC [Halomicrococcus gelatinilyticus]|uniref:twin-arginine translocase subunit TatC n=1 Tax=Halomicrococcus gelatinilyticus TaxID=1702103 RepID=UPI002E157303
MGETGGLGLDGVLGRALSSVRSELRAAFVVFVVGFLATFYAMRIWVWPALMRRLLSAGADVVAVTPFDVVLLQAKLGLFGGLLLATGLVAYRSRSAVRARGVAPPGSPATHLGVAVAAVVLFVAGVAYAYVIFLPLLFDFLVSNAIAAGFQPTYAITDWTQFVLLLSLVLGLAAELPLVMGGLVYAEVVSYETMRNRWRHAVFAIVVVSSMVNGSPDPFSMTLVAIPMTSLFAVGLGCARVVSTATTRRDATASAGEPTVDLAALDAAGVRAAPPEAFAALTEHDALALADAALDDGDPGRADAVLDGFDAYGDEGVGDDSRDNSRKDAGRTSSADRPLAGSVERTAVGMAGAFVEDDAEDDVGGYYWDLRFVLDSLAARSFRIVGLFSLVVGLTFTALYSGGIGLLKRDFLARLPADVPRSSLDIVLLHPVEALAFQMKLSLIAGVVAVLPLVGYYAWPAVVERGLAGGDRSVFRTWAAVLAGGLLAGSAAGYYLVAPVVVSALVTDAVRADMVLAYRVAPFFWLVFATTVGVGLLAAVPLTMLLFHRGGVVSYRTMRRRWRVVAVGVLVLASMLPGGVLLMLGVGVAVTAAYGVGLGLLWLVTLGSRVRRPTPT